VPLKHIFGYFDDYDKVIFGIKHQLTLVSKGDNDAFSKLLQLILGRLFRQNWHAMCPTCFQRLNENLLCTKQLRVNHQFQ